MRYFITIIAALSLAHAGCSSFKNKNSRTKQNEGDAQGANDDTINTQAQGNNDGLEKSIVVTANGQPDILSVDGTTNVTIAWESQGYDNCELKGTTEKGLTGSKNVGVVTSDTTYTVECTEGDDKGSKDVDVRIEPPTPPAPTVAIKARPAGTTVYVADEITVDYGTDVQLQMVSNAAAFSCSLQPLSEIIAAQSTVQFNVSNMTQTTIFSFKCEGTEDGMAIDTVKVNVNPPPNIAAWIKVNDQLNSIEVARDSNVTVAWFAENATSCAVSIRDSDPLDILNAGVPKGTPTQFTYLVEDMTILDLECTGLGGTTFATAIAIHIKGEINGEVDLQARVKGTTTYTDGPLLVDLGDEVEIKWTSCVTADGVCQNDPEADCKVVTPFDGTFPPAGTADTSKGTAVLKDVALSQSLLLYCSLPIGSVVHDFLTIQLGPIPAPTATIKANGKDDTLNINYGEDVAISWDSTNADECTVAPIEFKGLSGHVVIDNFTQTTAMTVRCTGPGGTASDVIVINVPAGPDDPGGCQTESCWYNEAKKACASDSATTISFTAAMPNPGPCQFDMNGNLGPFIGNAYLRLRAAEQSDIALSQIPVGSFICGGSIQLSKKGNTNVRAQLYYNDQLFQLMSNAVISTSVDMFTNNLERNTGFYAFDKTRIIGDQGYNVDGQGDFNHYCAAGDPVLVPAAATAPNPNASCVAPRFNINQAANLGAFSQTIPEALALKLSTYKIMRFGVGTDYEYSLGAFGDQDTFDCKVGDNYGAAGDATNSKIELDFSFKVAPVPDNPDDM